MYKIEKHVPLPNAKTFTRVQRFRDTLTRMIVGDSFVIPRKDFASLRSTSSIVPYSCARKEFGMRLQAKKVYQNQELVGIRVWRVK